MIDELYNSAILTLASGISHVGHLDKPDATSSKTARLCGSTISVEVVLDEAERITEFAQQVKACALGQAAAAILGEQVIGATPEQVKTAQDQLWDMLQNNGPAPTGRFADLEKLAGVAAYPQRHASTALAFDALVDALEKAKQARQQ